MKRNKSAAVICLSAWLMPYAALACRYAVREVGFVDLGDRPYRLYGYVSQDTPAAMTSDFARISQASLLDSNVNFEMVNREEQKDHPAMGYLERWPMKSFPAAILVSPDGQTLTVPIEKPDESFQETLQSALHRIVSSPKRDEIVKQVTTSCGAILLIEGTDAEGNRKARKAAFGAIEKTGLLMETVPETIARPPGLIVIDRESFTRERILLWSLGLGVEEVGEPRAAVVYGRVRWVGPLMKGEEITEGNLTGILSVVGADCECGFDTSWTQGTMLPVRWGKEIRARVAKTLGFDPENPVVKMEVSGILKKEYSGPGVPFGYTELAVESQSPSEAQGTHRHGDRNGILPEAPPGKMLSGEPPPASTGLALRKSFYFLGGLALFVIVTGLFILSRSVTRNS